MTFTEVKKLPIVYRKWFLKRIVREFDDQVKSLGGNRNSDLTHDNMNKLRQYEDMLTKKT